MASKQKALYLKRVSIISLTCNLLLCVHGSMISHFPSRPRSFLFTQQSHHRNHPLFVSLLDIYISFLFYISLGALSGQGVYWRPFYLLRVAFTRRGISPFLGGAGVYWSASVLVGLQRDGVLLFLFVSPSIFGDRPRPFLFGFV